MAKKKDKFDPIVLDYPFHRGSVVNDFLKETGLSENFRVVIVHVQTHDDDEYYSSYKPTFPNAGGVDKKGGPKFYNKVVSRIGLEPLNEQTYFYWKLRGPEKLKEAVEDYINGRPFNKGVS